VSELLIHAAAEPAPDGSIVSVTPQSACWRHVGFEVLALGSGGRARRDSSQREVCIVVIAGSCDVRSEHGGWLELGERESPFGGPPDAAYLPPPAAFEVTARGTGAEVGLCFAPAGAGAAARVLPAGEIVEETRGYGAQERTVRPILMATEPADSLLVCEVITPGGNWSSYPPHKHDVDAMPRESALEETYYHRISPNCGFALQRVYSADGELDETMSVRDRDTVLVPRGYHTVSAPPGYDLYYLNVMAGPTRAWAIANDPDHEWRLRPPSA
jgi:5-deoxy-glucuronate isomerase